MEEILKKIISHIGDDPKREGLLETPKRIIKSWEKLFEGYKKNPKDIFKTFVEGSCDEMVILKDIEFYSHCEHHFVSFFGKVHIGYLPDKRVIGISKLARLVDIYARRLQIQERMVAQIADDLMKYLKPKGCIVIAEAIHLCMVARGVEKKNSKMICSAVRGVFREEPDIKNEFLNIIK